MLAPSRRSDKLAKQTATILGALDSGHVIAAIVSAIPGSVYMLTENFIDDEIRCLPVSYTHLTLPTIYSV